MKILIPGGHLTPALGLIDWIQAEGLDDEIVFVGRIYSQSKYKQKAVEAYEVTKRGVRFIPLKAEKLGKENLFSIVIKSIKFIKSIFQAHKIVKQEQPDVLMSFGGYVALPLAIVCWFVKIPIFTHEATRVVGMANKILFKLADKIGYTYPDLANFNLNQLQKPVIKTGTPLRSAILNAEQTSQPSWLSSAVTQPILLVMGGNQGALALNEFVKANLKDLTQDYILVHQCGRPNRLADYPQDLSQAAKKQQVQPDKYYPLTWIDAQDLVWLYRHAKLALTRAGANTIEELIFMKLPSILVPLPHSHFDEQLRNAQHLTNAGAAYLLDQAELNLESFKVAAEEISRHRLRYLANLDQLKHKQEKQASLKIYQELEKLIKNN